MIASNVVIADSSLVFLSLSHSPYSDTDLHGRRKVVLTALFLYLSVSLSFLSLPLGSIPAGP